VPALLYLQLSDKLACQGAQAIYGVLRPADLVTASDVRAIEDQESLTFSYARLDTTNAIRPITAQLKASRVITVAWDDGSFDEWRVGPITTGRGERGLITVTCVPLWLDVIERSDSAAGKGWMSGLVAGIRSYRYEITQQTATQIFTNYLFTPPVLPAWVSLGTVDPTYVIPSLTIDRLTPGGLMIAVRDALRSVDVACELRLRRNGTTDYKLDLVTQIGASGATPVFHPVNSLLTVQQRSDPTLQATRVLTKGATNPDGNLGSLGVSRWRGGAPSGLAVVLTDRNGGASCIGFDNQWVGNHLLRVKTGRTFPITASSAAAGTVTLGGGVSTIAADEDFEFRIDEPLTNTRTTTTRYAVSAVPDGTHITCGVSVPITADDQYVDWYAKVWSAAVAGTVIATTRITDSVAATDVLTVTSSAGVNNTHYVEFVQLDGAGEIPDYVDHPTYAQADPIGYGVKVAEIAKPQAGVTQLAPNAWMRTWTNGANPPDGWSIASTGNAGSFTQNSSAAYTRYGGYSYHVTGAASGAHAPASITTPPAYPNWSNAQTTLSVRAYVYFQSWPFGYSGSCVLTVHARTASGGLGASLGAVRVYPGSGPGVAPSEDYAVVSTGEWIELAVKVTLDATTTPYGVVGVFELDDLVPPGTLEFYLDAIEMYALSACPSDAHEFGDATGLLQAGNNQLRLVASPPLFYTFTIRDLERGWPTEFARLAVTLGANARAADIEYGIDTTVRVLKIERDLLSATVTKLTLANRPALLTNIQAGDAATQQRVIAAVTQGQTNTLASGPTFATITGAATLPEGSELAVVSGTGSITVGPDSSIQFKSPLNTSPTTGVTQGTPPSRKFKLVPLY
jgi:hypothetical protein